MFVSRVVKAGRTFVRRMIETSKRIKHLHHRVKLNNNFRADVNWWLAFLQSWNGISMFVDEQWVNSDKIHLYTDASDLAFGCVLDDEWCVLPFIDNFSYLANKSIGFRELLAVVIAISTWSKTLANKKVLLFCDNMSMCHVINSGVSKNTDIMCLVRYMFFVCAHNNILCRAQHLASHENALADSLSRLEFNRFQSITCRNTKCIVPVIDNWFTF